MAEVTQRFLALSQLILDEGIQPRITLNQGMIAHYAALYRTEDGEYTLPPLDVFAVDERYLVADGFHRVAAARTAQLPSLPCLVHEGTYRDAMLFAAEANVRHGVPYTSGDKQRISGRVLADAVIAQCSNREIAKRFGTSHTYVNRLRTKLTLLQAFHAELQQHMDTVSVLPNGLTAEHVALGTMLALPPQQIKRAIQRGFDMQQQIGRLAATSREGPHTVSALKAALSQQIQTRFAPARTRQRSTRHTTGHTPSQTNGVAAKLSAADATSTQLAAQMLAATFAVPVPTETSRDAVYAALAETVRSRYSPALLPAEASQPVADQLLTALYTLPTPRESLSGAVLSEAVSLANVWWSRLWGEIMVMTRAQEHLRGQNSPAEVLSALLTQLEARLYTVDGETARQDRRMAETLRAFLATQQWARRIVEL